MLAPHNEVVHEARRARVDWYWLVLVVVVLGALMIAYWPGGADQVNPRSSALPPVAGASTPRAEPGPSATGGTASPPELSGYEYRVSEEHYVVRQQDGQFEVQDRRRESWRAPDGWAWARQTGSDPGRFIFSPDVDWKIITAARPTTAAQQQVLRKVASAGKDMHLVESELAFVEDLLSSESVPASALPKNYRMALVNAMASNDRVTLTRHVTDPRGRDSIRLSSATGASASSLYLDPGCNFLAYTISAKDTGERGSRVVTDERQVDTIPQDLLAQLGSARVEKSFYD